MTAIETEPPLPAPIGALATAWSDLRTSKSALATSLETNAFLEGVLNATRDCIIVLALDGTLVFMNASGLAIMEIDDFSLVEGSPWPTLWDEDYNEASLAAMAMARSGETGHFIARAHTTKQMPRWWDVTVSPILDAEGRTTMLLSISRDITIAKSLELQRELLAGELSHRVKNVLAVVQAIAVQTFRGGDPRQLGAFAARLAALGGAQALLIQTAWQSAPIDEVIAKALAPHSPGGRCTLCGPRLDLDSKRALALALAIHELATNAVKYGALSNDAGEVAVVWTIDDGELRLTWTESGGPPVAAAGPAGFGTRLVTRNLASEFDGTVDMQLRAEGVVLTLTAPA